MIYFICPYPPGKAPSQRFRFEQYIDYVQEDYRQVGFWRDDEWPAIYKTGSVPFKVWRTLWAFLRRLLLLFQLSDAKVVFIHREATPIGPAWFEWAVVKILKKDLIYDFDDAIWLPNSSAANAKLVGGMKSHSKVGKICRLARTVVVGNQFLADYATQFCNDVRIIPTTIDTEGLHNPARFTKPQNQKPVIGWTGTHSTLKQLTPLFAILEEVYAQHPFQLIIIADQAPANMPEFARFIPWNKETEIADLMQFDIGLMPLYDTDWEKGKCAFKALQYMALEIPVVASAVGVNAEAITHGAEGFLAEAMPLTETKQWETALFSLLTNPTLRSELGTKGRQRIIDAYSVLSQKEKFLQVLSFE